MRAAAKYSHSRDGVVSFAVVDEKGKLHAHHGRRVHHSASVVKVMLMVAYLREPDVRGRALGKGDKDLLRPMIRHSDNDAATAIYNRVGAEALYGLARDARMRGATASTRSGS
jgi:beta-lactamase class A